MAEYKMVRLGDVCEIQSGGTPSRSKTEYWKDGTIPWVKIGDFSGKYLDKTTEHITQQGLDNSSAKLFSKGTILYSIFATLGEATILNIDATTNQAIAGIKIKDKSSVDIDYFYSFLKSLKDEVNRIGRGVAQNNINLSILKSFFIPLPPLETQKQIAAQLDKCTAVIAKHKQMLEKYDTLIKSRFIEMFGDPSKNNKKWKIKKLGDIIRVLGGYAFSSKAFKDFGIPVLRIGNINSGVFRPTNMVFWDDDEKIERYAIYPGDLVMSLTGTVGKDDYGNVCILGNDYPKYYLNQRNAKLEIISDLERFYLSYLLKFPEIKSRLTNISRGIRQANIANKDIEKLQIPVPPLSLQQQFAAFVQQIDKSKFEIANSLKRLYNKGMLS